MLYELEEYLEYIKKKSKHITKKELDLYAELYRRSRTGLSACVFTFDDLEHHDDPQGMLYRLKANNYIDFCFLATGEVYCHVLNLDHLISFTKTKVEERFTFKNHLMREEFGQLRTG